MKRQSTHLDLDRLTIRAGLALRDAGCDHDVAEKAGIAVDTREWRVGRKGQNVGRSVDPPKPAVKRPHLCIAHERNSQFSARSSGRDTGKPPRETARRHLPAPPISHSDPKPRYRRHSLRHLRFADKRVVRPARTRGRAVLSGSSVVMSRRMGYRRHRHRSPVLSRRTATPTALRML